MSIPRRIEPEKINGYVLCLDCGPLAYENDDDKQKLIALSELFREGRNRRSIGIDKKYLQPVFRSGITSAQIDAMNVLWKHQGLNAVLDVNLLRQMVKIAKKGNKEILMFTMKEVRRLRGGWFSWLRPGKK